jgi:hypothetical protein
MTTGKWTSSGQASLALAKPLPRDPRGRLEMTAGALRLNFPGVTCSGSLSPSLRIACASGSETWPLNPRDPAFQVRWTADRNTLESDSVHSTFYNAAAGLFATTGGKIEDRAGEPTAGAEKWGTDLTNPLVIATTAGDATAGDQIQIYDIANGQAAPASNALPLNGPVMALWPAETAGQASLVVRNSKTGFYEASRLGLACAE